MKSTQENRDSMTFETEIPMNETYQAQVISDSLDILYSVSELAHIRISKLLKGRIEPNTKTLLLPEFVEYYKMTLDFIQQSEQITGKQSFGLRPTLYGQVSSIILLFSFEFRVMTLFSHYYRPKPFWIYFILRE